MVKYKLPQKSQIFHRKSETRQNKIGRYESRCSFCTILLHVYLSVPVFAGQPSLYFLLMPHVSSELPWGLFISSFVCLFVCAFGLLCSWANKAPFCPGCWYGPIKACDQPERFNDGSGAGVDQLTARQRGKERWHAVRWWLQLTSVVAQWLHCRQQTG